MKRRDILSLVVAVVVLMVTGFLAFQQLSPTKPKEVQVEVVSPISASFDQSALDILSDQAQARNFTPPIDLSAGLNNDKPFNPL